ncbi:MAG: DUF4348 domain-containing protein [Taibaiella sp.]|nr:DUF4348 domain-containing protein [Taibaiella sp.]
MNHKAKYRSVKKIHLQIFILLACTSLAHSCASHKNQKLSFDLFLNQFMNDSTFQKQHIEYPLITYYSDEDFPLDILEVGINAPSDYTFIDMKDHSPLTRNDTNRYEIHINQNTDTFYYHKTGVNNGTNIIYKFQRTGKSYKLFEIGDYTD